jgi:hypothetical protein
MSVARMGVTACHRAYPKPLQHQPLWHCGLLWLTEPKVFCKRLIQKGHFVKIWGSHFMDPLFEIEKGTPYP